MEFPPILIFMSWPTNFPQDDVELRAKPSWWVLIGCHPLPPLLAFQIDEAVAHRFGDGGAQGLGRIVEIHAMKSPQRSDGAPAVALT